VRDCRERRRWPELRKTAEENDMPWPVDDDKAALAAGVKTIADSRQ